MLSGPNRWRKAAGLRIVVACGFLVVTLFLAVQAPSIAGLLRRSLISSVFAQPFPGPSAAEGQPLKEFVVKPRGIVNVAELPSPSPEEMAPTPRVIPFRVPNPELYRQLKEQLQQGGLALEPAPPSLAPSLAPSLLLNFIGLQDSDNVTEMVGAREPPDTQVAAGPADLFEMVNLVGRITDKTGNLVSEFPLNSFFGLSPVSTTFTSDPVVRFDPMSGRWFAVLLSLNGSSGASSTGGQLNLAVSSSSDPTASFFLYVIPTPNSFADFPKIGFNDDKLVLTRNVFSCVPNCSAGGMLGSAFIVLNKSELVAGVTVAALESSVPADSSTFTIEPATSLSSTPTLFMGSVDVPSSSFIRIWSVSGVPGVGAGASVSTTTQGIRTLISPPGPVQPGPNPVTTAIDNRLLDAGFRNGSFWLSATSGCIPSGDTIVRSCVRLTEVLTSSLTVNQDFDFGTNGGYYYYPAIAQDSAGNLDVVFSASSSSEFPSVYASGRLTSDPLNTLQAPVEIKAGEASYNGSRWGDYSAVAIDPSDETVAWGAGEYATAAAGANWGTRIAELKAAAVPSDTTPPSITITAPANGNSYKRKKRVAAMYSCTDPDDAVATCDGPVASGSNFDTSSRGMHTFTVTASDSHGNTSSASVTYTVGRHR